ncbi:MAG: hypothetical protein BGN96_12910 [Bacteroidales bacterium 45-6]|nr:MAG: hypothetical protein BGN96_12910 [Bacteroidales bacterium 45-6]
MDCKYIAFYLVLKTDDFFFFLKVIYWVSAKISPDIFLCDPEVWPDQYCFNKRKKTKILG